MHGMEFRHYYLAKNFIELGYSVTIISATQSHLFQNAPKDDNAYNFEKIDSIQYIWSKVFKYKNSKDKLRILKWFWFCLKLYFLPLKKIDKPDVIIMSSAAPFIVYPCLYLKKKFNAKLVFEVKDIWPLSLMNIGGFKATHPFIKLMANAEKKSILKSDFVVSNLPNYQEHVDTLKLNVKTYWMPNGIERSEEHALNDNTKSKLPKNKFVIGYAGTIGQANAINYLLESAKLLLKEVEIAFVIVGNGLEKEQYQKFCQANNLINVTFLEAIPKDEVQALLSHFDLNFIGWRNEEIYKYGIAANKIFDYMLSGKPILHSFSGKGDIIESNNCGITVPAENPAAIAEAIINFYKMDSAQRMEYGKNGRASVLEKFTYKKISENYITLFQ